MEKTLLWRSGSGLRATQEEWSCEWQEATFCIKGLICACVPMRYEGLLDVASCLTIVKTCVK